MADRARAIPENKLQGFDRKVKKQGRKLGMTRILPAPWSLSGRMYKICTLLSTGFVDNAARSAEGAARKATAGAAFGRATARLWGDGNDVEKGPG
jgi:hypothetical protein